MSRSELKFDSLSGQGLRFGIVAARYNEDLVEPYLEKIVGTLRESGALPDEMEIIRVPGSGEVPYATNLLVETGSFDCLIALGVVIGGETDHHHLIAETTGHALQSIALDTFVPVVNGIIVASSWEVAAERSLGSASRAQSLAKTALEMAQLKIRLSERLEEQQEIEDGAPWAFDEASDEDLEDPPESWKS